MRTLKVFTATWCQPCQQLKAVLSKTDLAGVNLVTVDVDAWKEEAIACNIRSVPTMVLYENNVELARKTGVMQSEQIKFLVNKQYGFTE